MRAAAVVAHGEMQLVSVTRKLPTTAPLAQHVFNIKLRASVAYRLLSAGVN